MGALPKQRISPYRRGKRRSSIKKKMKKKLQSYKTTQIHTLKKAKKAISGQTD